eukprot:gene1598-28506_t
MLKMREGEVAAAAAAHLKNDDIPAHTKEKHRPTSVAGAAGAAAAIAPAAPAAIAAADVKLDEHPVSHAQKSDNAVQLSSAKKGGDVSGGEETAAVGNTNNDAAPAVSFARATLEQRQQEIQLQHQQHHYYNSYQQQLQQQQDVSQAQMELIKKQETFVAIVHQAELEARQLAQQGYSQHYATQPAGAKAPPAHDQQQLEQHHIQQHHIRIQQHYQMVMAMAVVDAQQQHQHLGNGSPQQQHLDLQQQQLQALYNADHPAFSYQAAGMPTGMLPVGMPHQASPTHVGPTMQGYDIDNGNSKRAVDAADVDVPVEAHGAMANTGKKGAGAGAGDVPRLRANGQPDMRFKRNQGGGAASDIIGNDAIGAGAGASAIQQMQLTGVQHLMRQRGHLGNDCESGLEGAGFQLRPEAHQHSRHGAARLSKLAATQYSKRNRRGFSISRASAVIWGTIAKVTGTGKQYTRGLCHTHWKHLKSDETTATETMGGSISAKTVKVAHWSTVACLIKGCLSVKFVPGLCRQLCSEHSKLWKSGGSFDPDVSVLEDPISVRVSTSTHKRTHASANASVLSSADDRALVWRKSVESKTCKIPGCSSQVNNYARHMCNKHFQDWRTQREAATKILSFQRNHFRITGKVYVEQSDSASCTVLGCPDVAAEYGLCWLHYAAGLCDLAGCDGIAQADGFCEEHAMLDAELAAQNMRETGTATENEHAAAHGVEADAFKKAKSKVALALTRQRLKLMSNFDTDKQQDHKRARKVDGSDQVVGLAQAAGSGIDEHDAQLQLIATPKLKAAKSLQSQRFQQRQLDLEARQPKKKKTYNASRRPPKRGKYTTKNGSPKEREIKRKRRRCIRPSIPDDPELSSDPQADVIGGNQHVVASPSTEVEKGLSLNQGFTHAVYTSEVERAVKAAAAEHKRAVYRQLRQGTVSVSKIMAQAASHDNIAADVEVINVEQMCPQYAAGEVCQAGAKCTLKHLTGNINRASSRRQDTLPMQTIKDAVRSGGQHSERQRGFRQLTDFFTATAIASAAATPVTVAAVAAGINQTSRATTMAGPAAAADINLNVGNSILAPPMLTMSSALLVPSPSPSPSQMRNATTRTSTTGDAGGNASASTVDPNHAVDNDDDDHEGRPGHDGQKVHICPSCNKKFGQIGNLNRHMLVHTNEKPYVCNTCGTVFSQKSHLKTHMVCHTGAKPYQCIHCDKRFTQHSHLKQHLANHEKALVERRTLRCYLQGCATKSWLNRSDYQLHMEEVHSAAVEQPGRARNVGSSATAAKILKCHGTRQREADEAEFDEAPRGASSSSSIIEDAAGTQSATIRFGGSASALTTMTHTDAETMTHTDAATGSEATVEDHRA